MSTELDRAWHQINSIGGSRDKHDLFDAGYDCALHHALQIIERLGGKDPLVRAAGADGSLPPPRYVPGSQGPWERPSYHKQAVGMRAEDMLPDATFDTPPDGEAA